MIKVTNIEWDVDDERDLENLPSEIILPEGFSGDNDAISDYISDMTGFCHKGFKIELDAEACERKAPKTQFALYKDLTNINDSMMMDSGTTIAVVITPEGKEMSLEVRGEVRVSPYDEEGDADGETYRSYSEMPQDLKDAIRDGKLDEVAYVGDNNWFEVFYDSTSAFVDNCEVVDAENCSPTEIYSLMADMINQVEEREVVPPVLNESVEFLEFQSK